MRLWRSWRSKRLLELSRPLEINSVLRSRPMTCPLLLQVTPTQEQQSVLEFQDMSLEETEESNTTVCFKWSNDSCWSSIHLLWTAEMILAQIVAKNRKKLSKVFILDNLVATLSKSEELLMGLVAWIGCNWNSLTFIMLKIKSWTWPTNSLLLFFNWNMSTSYRQILTWVPKQVLNIHIGKTGTSWKLKLGTTKCGSRSTFLLFNKFGRIEFVVERKYNSYLLDIKMGNWSKRTQILLFISHFTHR